MNDDQSKTLTALLVDVGIIKTNSDNTLHRVRNIEQSLQAFVPRPEIKTAHDAMDDRLKTLEDNQRWATRAIVSAWMAGIAFAGTVARKSGLWLVLIFAMTTVIKAYAQ